MYHDKTNFSSSSFSLSFCFSSKKKKCRFGERKKTRQTDKDIFIKEEQKKKVFRAMGTYLHDANTTQKRADSYDYPASCTKRQKKDEPKVILLNSKSVLFHEFRVFRYLGFEPNHPN